MLNPYEGLFYIDNDYLDIFRKVGSDPEEPELRARGQLDYDEVCGSDWELDVDETELSWQCDKANLKYYINKRFPSFLPCKENVKHIGRDVEVIMENELFYIGIADNQWSIAIMLLQKDHWRYDASSLQKRHYQNYLDGIRDSLFMLYPELGVYAGAWTHGTIRREDYE